MFHFLGRPGPRLTGEKTPPLDSAGKGAPPLTGSGVDKEEETGSLTSGGGAKSGRVMVSP